MKNALKFISLMLAFAALSFVQSCKESEKIQPAATVTLDKTTAQDKPGAKVTINATVSAPNGGTLLIIYVGGVEASSADLAGQTSATKTYEHTIPANALVGSDIIVTFQVTDSKGFSSTIASCKITVGSPIVELTGILTGAALNLVKGTPYLIKGQAFVASGTTLTVAAGTVVKGDKATKGTLIIQPGGKIMAVGTVAEPIVFTSAQNAGERDRGDWGGILLLGNAFVNQSAKPAIEGITPSQQYGTVDATQADATVGANTEDNGKLKYVRIEYAGIELTPNNETNSLTMGAVGSTTEIDFVQASYGGDDSFEWFGGTVSAKHLVSLSTWDDDLDTDFGWRGNVQWALVVRNPFAADQSGSTAFESDSQGNGNPIGSFCTSPGGGTGTAPTTPTAGQIAGCTQGVFSNVTVLGPREWTQGLTGSFSSGGARAMSGNYTRAMHIRRRSAIGIFNSFIAGWGGASPTQQGLTMDDQGTLDNFQGGFGVFGNNVLMVPDQSATANSEYTSNVATANTGAVKTFWETTGASLIVKPGASTQWSLTPGTPAGSVDPYTTPYGIAASLFFGSNTPLTYPSNPNFAVASGNLQSQTPGVLFASSRMSSFFDKTLTYKGAFDATDWTDGWSEFQPLTKSYPVQ